MSSEQKISTKPKVYQFTDKYTIYIICTLSALLLLFFLITEPIHDAVYYIFRSLVLGLGGYFGIKKGHKLHAKTNPSMTPKILKIFIGFFWGAGIFAGLIYPTSVLIFSKISDIYSVINVLVGIFIIPGFSIALGSSHSWKYLKLIEIRK